jgi:hypothetical protein
MKSFGYIPPYCMSFCCCNVNTHGFLFVFRRVPSVFAPQLSDAPDFVRPLITSEAVALELSSKDPTLRVTRVYSKDTRFVVSLSKNLEVWVVLIFCFCFYFIFWFLLLFFFEVWSETWLFFRLHSELAGPLRKKFTLQMFFSNHRSILPIPGPQRRIFRAPFMFGLAMM